MVWWLEREGPLGLLCLVTGGTAWEGLGGVDFLAEVCHWVGGGGEVSKDLSHFQCLFPCPQLVNQDVSSPLFLPSCLCSTITDSNSPELEAPN